MDISFSVPAVPIAQPRQRHRIAGAPGSQFVHNYTPTKAPVNAFKAAVAIAFCNEHTGPPAEGPIRLWVTFLMPRPKRLIWKRKAMQRSWHVSKPDCDNLVKGVKDSLKMLAWRDDSQVCWMNVNKLYAAGDEQPHVEIRIVTEEA